MPSFNVGRQPEPGRPSLTPERRKELMDEAFDALSEEGIHRMMRSVWDHINDPDTATAWLRVATDPDHQREVYDITDAVKQGLRDRGLYSFADDFEFIAIGKLHSKLLDLVSGGEVSCRMHDGSNWHPMTSTPAEAIAVLHSIREAALANGWSTWMENGESMSPWEIDREVASFAESIPEEVNNDERQEPGTG